MKTRLSKNNNRGFTLIELIIAMGLSLLLLAGMLSIYLYGTLAIKHMEQRVSVQQDARFALTSLEKDLRSAGTFGCALPNTAATPNGNFHNAQSGAKWLGFIPSSIGVSQQQPFTWGGSSYAADANDDALIIQYGEGITDAVVNTAGGVNKITATVSSTRPQISKAATLALASCERLDLFPNNGNLKTNTFSVSPDHNLVPPLTKTNGVELMRLVTIAYSIGTYNKHHGLYMFELDEHGNWGAPKEIAENVTGLKKEFGYQDCVPGKIQEINTVFYKSLRGLNNAQLESIGLVRLTLDMQADDPNLGDPINNKNKITKTYSVTVALRRGNICVSQPPG